MVKMVELNSQYLEIRNNLRGPVEDILMKGNFVRGEDVALLETELAEFLGVKHCISCASGTDALTLSFMAIGLGRGDEVIMPSFSFAAMAEAVALSGATPVFADVDPQTFNIDLQSVERLMTERTKAIVPVHLFGQPCDMNSLMEIAIRRNVKIIEDNAQSLGSMLRMSDGRQRYAGTVGDIGCTSFFPTKPLGAFGDGGAVFTDDDFIAERVRTLANHGQKIKYNHQLIGINSRLDTLQAAVLRAKLPFLDAWTESRRRRAAYYSSELKEISGIELPVEAVPGTHVYHQYTIKVAPELRDGLRRHLESCGISSMVYYPIPLHRQQAYRDISICDQDMADSERLADTVISIPMHSHLSSASQDEVIAAIRSFFSGTKRNNNNG